MRSALLLLIPACTTNHGNATLADLGNLQVQVQGFSPSDTQPTTGFVALGYDTAAFQSAHGGQCAVVDGIIGSFNGTALDSDGGCPDDLGDCLTPSVGFAVEFAGASTFVVGDDSLTVTAVFAEDAFAPHVPTLRAPAQWQFTGGEAVRVGWSDPADLMNLGVEPFRVTFSADVADNNTIDLTPTYSGDEIDFTVPSPPSVTGPGSIVFRFGYANGNATTCTNATSCIFSATLCYEHRVTIGD